MRIPIAPEGWVFVLAPLGAAVLSLVAMPLLGGAALWLVAGFALLALFCCFFFRDPERRVPDDANLLVAPADGKVTEAGPSEGGMRVSIFLSLFDVHVNRSPVAGRVEAVRYREGDFRAAFRKDAAERNERNEVEMSVERQNGSGVVRVRQIAGVVARRIVCRARPGDTLTSGERFGLIRFGSRTDTLLPNGVEVLVEPGDRVRGGETVIARWV